MQHYYQPCTPTTQHAEAFLNALQNTHDFGFTAVSLGCVHTLMSISSATAASGIAAADRDKAGIGEGLVRVSVGITGCMEQRWAQLQAAVEGTLLS